jgi:hypothetical protein
MTTNRRFPPPWSIEDIGAAYVVKDSLVIGFFDPGDRDAIEFGVSHQPALLAFFNITRRSCASQVAPPRRWP